MASSKQICFVKIVTRRFSHRFFGGVEDQHHNFLSERAIETIMYMARTFMVYNLLHWTDYAVDDLLLYYFVVQHAVWMYNCMKNCQTGIHQCKC